MKPDRAFIDLAFPHPVYGTFTPIKLHLEYPLREGETEADAWDAGEKAMKEWVSFRYPDVDFRPGTDLPTHMKTEVTHSQLPTITKEPEDRRIGIVIADIYSCDTIKVLESYKLIAKTKPELQAAYDQQYAKLSKTTIKEE